MTLHIKVNKDMRKKVTYTESEFLGQTHFQGDIFCSLSLSGGVFLRIKDSLLKRRFYVDEKPIMNGKIGLMDFGEE